MAHCTTRTSRSLLAILGSAAVIFAAIYGMSSTNPVNSKPAEPEAAPAPRPAADIVPLYAHVETAKNPVRLCLQDDGRKVLGWVAGKFDLAGRPVYITVKGNSKRETVTVAKDNTFTWSYK